MKKKLRKSTKIASIVIFISIIVVAIYIFYNGRVNQELVFQSYDEALNWGLKEFDDKTEILKDVKVDDKFNNTNLIFYAIEDASKVYISKITSEKTGFEYDRLTPTFSWDTENDNVNASFDVPITINDKLYYVLIGKVDKSYKAYNNEEELELDLNRIFIKINTDNKNQVSFKKST